MRRAVNIMVTVLISVAFVLLGVFVFSSSYLRFWESCVDFLVHHRKREAFASLFLCK